MSTSPRTRTPELGDRIRTPGGRVGRVVHIYRHDHEDYRLAFVRLDGHDRVSRFLLSELTLEEAAS